MEVSEFVSPIVISKMASAMEVLKWPINTTFFFGGGSWKLIHKYATYFFRSILMQSLSIT